MNTPVLVIAFNRPETLKVLLERLKAARATQVYFAVDGPRAHRESDAPNVAAVKELIRTTFDPPAERCLFQPNNLGIRWAPPRAISWFFDQVEEGVILEDDCIPGDSFFPFVSWALEHYRHEERVMLISGFNRFGDSGWDQSFHFIKTAYIWGWASWRRAWKQYDPEMSRGGGLAARWRWRQWLGPLPVRDFWATSINDVLTGKLVTWDVAWCWTLLQKQGLAIMPRVSLIQNIGFGADATNTAAGGPVDPRSLIRPGRVEVPYKAPGRVTPDLVFQRSLDKAEFWRDQRTWKNRFIGTLKRIKRAAFPHWRIRAH